MAPGELRGSAPILTAKDVLLEVRADVKAMRDDVGVLMSQRLDTRLTRVEQNQWKLTGALVLLVFVISRAEDLARILRIGG